MTPQTYWAKLVQRWTGSDRLALYTYIAIAKPIFWWDRLRIEIYLACGGRP